MTVIPVLLYRDARAAIGWLERVLGFEPAAVHEGEDGRVLHAELKLGVGHVMVGSYYDPPETAPTPFGKLAAPPGQAATYVVVADATAHHARAVAQGAEVVIPLRDRGFTRDYTVRDPEGNLWSLGTYAPGG
jgi:uncharacterized glyoxalase superfamily protein PhnB